MVTFFIGIIIGTFFGGLVGFFAAAMMAISKCNDAEGKDKNDISR